MGERAPFFDVINANVNVDVQWHVISNLTFDFFFSFFVVICLNTNGWKTGRDNTPATKSNKNKKKGKIHGFVFEVNFFVGLKNTKLDETWKFI
jgi:hypothetical protein